MATTSSILQSLFTLEINYYPLVIVLLNILVVIVLLLALLTDLVFYKEAPTSNDFSPALLPSGGLASTGGKPPTTPQLPTPSTDPFQTPSPTPLQPPAPPDAVEAPEAHHPTGVDGERPPVRKRLF